MNILGLKIEECCGASIMVDGEIIAACSEERFTGRKNEGGFPYHSVIFCLKEAKIEIENIDIIAVESLHTSIDGLFYSYCQKRATFSIKDYIREQKEVWYPVLYEKKNINYLDVFEDKMNRSVFPESFNKYFFSLLQKNKDMTIDKTLDADTCREVKKQLIISYFPTIDKNKIIFTPHHEVHAFYGYFSSPFVNDKDPVMIVTADSDGDFENATVSVFDKDGFKILHSLDNHNFGLLYRHITLYLGMKPYEHEYKVMGLAAYSSDYQSDPVFDIFNKIMDVDGINFYYKNKPIDNYFWFKDKLEGMRFDGIAGGLQKYLEKCMGKWFDNIIDKFKIKKIIFSGGIAMNVKLNMKLALSENITHFFVPASPDDTTNCIGACFHAHYNSYGRTDIKPLKDVYLGEDIYDEDISVFIKKNKLDKFCDIYEVDSKFVAKKIEEGKIIGRCAGRMEFGARSLGNRSILADPRDDAIVERINKVIKKRDFWMPFAPVIIDEYWDKYLVNIKNIYSPYMTVGFKTTNDGEKDLKAAIHPADKTTRPQMLIRENNPNYYDIIKEFALLTGVGALLNTSFNLHGYPIIRTAEDAIYVFLNSELDALLLNNIYIEKRK